MTEHIDLQHKLVNDVYAELGTISKHSQDVIDYLMRHGWIRTSAEAEAAARGGKVERSAKYADLIHEIEESDSMTGCERATVEAVLDWFDRNTSQIPGPTIKESNLTKSVGDPALDGFAAGFAAGFRYAGGQVLPDPKPTNAEMMEEILIDFECHPAHLIAEHLDKNGVTAPGGDHE